MFYLYVPLKNMWIHMFQKHVLQFLLGLLFSFFMLQSFIHVQFNVVSHLTKADTNMLPGPFGPTLGPGAVGPGPGWVQSRAHIPCELCALRVRHCRGLHPPNPSILSIYMNTSQWPLAEECPGLAEDKNTSRQWDLLSSPCHVEVYDEAPRTHTSIRSSHYNS